MAAPLQHMLHAAQTMQPRLVQFVQTLVQTPSPPGHEEAAARLVQTEMRRLGYDDVTVDSYGNVIGQVKGGPGPTLMLNGHIDHVDPGDKTGWPHPPFSGQIAQGHLWGRGSVDMKGPVACMVYAPALLKEMGLTPPGDIYVTAVVMEEVGGVGSSYLATHLKTDLAVVGEPSGNTLRRGHRGRVEAQLTVTGKSIHASVPHLGVNP
ncbi:MAG: M20 family metallopeptidase, partial [Anaerolineae bacterium]